MEYLSGSICSSSSESQNYGDLASLVSGEKCRKDVQFREITKNLSVTQRFWVSPFLAEITKSYSDWED